MKIEHLKSLLDNAVEKNNRQRKKIMLLQRKVKGLQNAVKELMSKE